MTTTTLGSPSMSEGVFSTADRVIDLILLITALISIGVAIYQISRILTLLADLRSDNIASSKATQELALAVSRGAWPQRGSIDFAQSLARLVKAKNSISALSNVQAEAMNERFLAFFSNLTLNLQTLTQAIDTPLELSLWTSACGK